MGPDLVTHRVFYLQVVKKEKGIWDWLLFAGYLINLTEQRWVLREGCEEAQDCGGCQHFVQEAKWEIMEEQRGNLEQREQGSGSREKASIDI